MNARKQNSANYPVNFFMTSSSDHIAGAVGLAPAVTISKNGGAFAAAAGTVSEVGNGWYALAGNATDRNTLGEWLLHATAAGADSAERQIEIVPTDPFDANFGLQALGTLGSPGLSGGLPSLNAALNVAADLQTIKAQSVTCTGAVTVGANLGTTQPTNYTGIGTLALVKVDATDWGGVAVGGMPNSTAPPTAAAVATAVWTDLLASADFSTVSSIGKLLYDNINAQLSTLMLASSYTAPPPAATIAVAVRDVDNTSPAAGSLGAKVNAASAAGDPWAVALPGVYGAGTAGAILGAVGTAAGKLTFDASNYLKSHLMAYDGALAAPPWYTAPAVPTAAQNAAAVWQDAVPGDFTVAGSAGAQLTANGTTLARFNFDGSNNVFTSVRSYGSSQSPDYLVWSAASSAYTAGGSMGALQNAAVVGSYAAGAAPDYLVWGASLATYTGGATFGGKVNALANAGDPWATTLPTGYTGTQAGALLNSVYTVANRLTFDGSNNVGAVVNTYAAGQSPAASAWGALATAYDAAGTMGGLLNAASPGGGGATDPWASVLGTGGYAAGQAGYLVNQMGITVGKLGFDISNNVKATVAAYGSGLGPDAMTWGAMAAAYNGAGTMGALQNAPIVGGYAAGQAPEARTWGGLATAYNAAGTMGHLLNAAGSVGDPWLVDVRSGYLSTQAGGMLNQVWGRVDDSIGNITSNLMGYYVEPAITFLQAMRAAAAGAGGAVARIGTTNQFNVFGLGNPGGPIRMTVTTDPNYLTRYGITLNL